MKRIHWGTIAVAVVVIGLAVALLAQAKSKSVSLPPTAVIGNEYASAGGCSDTGHEAQIGIPNSQFLDTSVQDPVWHIQGITFRETNKIGNSGIRNVSMGSASVVKFQIFAGGGGTMQCVPLVGCSCVNGSGGSYGTEVTAHYKTATFTVE
jgi:hypothetical protein